MKYIAEIPQRKSIRLKEYDYSQAGLYFITVCVQNHECLFGKILEGKMNLNECGKIVEDIWDELPMHYPNIALPEFVIMPNHIHGIIQIDDADIDADFARAGLKPAPTRMKIKQCGLSEIVRALKTFSARKINEMRNTIGFSIWQRNFYEHIIRDEKDYLKIAEYIFNNPINWNTDELNNEM